MRHTFFSPTLNFYLGKKYFLHVAMATIFLGGFVLLLEMVELLRRLSGEENVANEAVLKLLFLKMPDMMMQMAPFAILLGTLICFARLTKDQEFIAIRSIGLPARAFLMPPLLISLIIGILNVAVGSPVASTTLKSYERIINDLFPGSAKGLVTEGGKIWLRQQDSYGTETIIHARRVEDGGRRLEEATLFMFDNLGNFTERLDAQKMYLQETHWQLNNVLRLPVGSQPQNYESLRLPTELTPDLIQNSFNSPNSLSVWELPQFIELLSQTGFPTAKHELHLHKLLATPALIVAMFLLAAPFALHFSRMRSMGSMIVVGLCFGFFFYLFTNFVGAYGLAGKLDLQLAAWMPTLIAALIAMGLLLHYREE